MPNEQVTNKFFKNCLFEEDYWTEMRKPFLKNYLRQDDSATNQSFLNLMKKSLISKELSPKKKIQNLEILLFGVSLQNQQFFSDLLDSPCWAQMKRISVAFLKPKYDKSLPKKFGEDWEYSEFWHFGRELLNLQISVGSEYGEFEDDEKTDFGIHLEEIINLMTKHGKPTKIAGHRISFSASELDRASAEYNGLDSVVVS